MVEYYRAIESRAIDKIIQFFGSDAQITFPGAPEHRGIESIKSFFEKVLFAQFLELRYNLLNTVSSSHVVATRALISGSVSNGRSFTDVKYTEFLEMHGDLIVHSDICIDMPSLRSQVGKW